MTAKEYLWFWKTSFSYMQGYSLFYILIRLPAATFNYRKAIIQDKLNKGK